MGKIPESSDEIGPVDELIIKSREAGMTWGDVTKLVTARLELDEPLKNTYCRKRYDRIKINCHHVPKEDLAALFTAKLNVEERNQKELWARIASEMQALGAASYPPATLERQLKRCHAEGVTAESVVELVESLEVAGNLQQQDDVSRAGDATTDDEESRDGD